MSPLVWRILAAASLLPAGLCLIGLVLALLTWPFAINGGTGRMIDGYWLVVGGLGAGALLLFLAGAYCLKRGRPAHLRNAHV